MEFSFKELRCKDVVNIIDGRNLGRPSDIVFTYPNGCVVGIAVPGKRGWNCFKRNDIFIPLKNIIKIGADVLLVDIRSTKVIQPHVKNKKYADRSYMSQIDYGEREEHISAKRDFSEYE